ncbi:unnamed protein product [Pleuronectes platessa]|uniref:Uncharacterized protein n=1 Tax=Pleuronectes platessa TaxID=8262 RepID=A0A9N7VAT3_PLEPL|nr:unnamed protein product [Pleuronectes platessa]
MLNLGRDSRVVDLEIDGGTTFPIRPGNTLGSPQEELKSAARRWHQANFAICLLSPFPCISSLLPPPPPSQSALHLLSLRACHPYGISEAGARHPLPLSPPPPPPPPHALLFHAPISTPTLPQSSPKGPEPGQKTKKRVEGNKKSPKLGYTPFHILLGACCASCAHRLEGKSCGEELRAIILPKERLIYANEGEEEEESNAHSVTTEMYNGLFR